ncbi:Beta-lactamase-like protein 2 [Tolypocladium ophioglossoides CBS 100239]|uniref:Beta-lactamase-like protein 2 n=1 Tax=Tolypocladium ophioglossoides (strain CBS 100239) TaxID=1163406 RepID=A0A0L0NAR2_TOLOC|nr:Beta-lactamase-like protein 2 [Tolypocladium ophioglossoides CBS 100239]
MGAGGYKQINKALNVCAFEDYLQTQQAQLPKLDNVQQLSPRVIRILGQNPGKFTLQGTNTYIVGTGKKRLIIDTGQGYREWADLVQGTLNESAIGLSQIMLTHWHGDHTGGVPDLVRMYPDLADCVFKNCPTEGQRPIADGDRFSVEGAMIRAVHGRGHSHDHVCFVLEQENAMFTGDNVLGNGTTAVEHLGLYMQTLEKLKAQGCILGYPAHGDVIPDLGVRIAGELASKIRREEKCLTVLSKLKRDNGGTGQIASPTVKELVVAMHGDKLDEDMREKALEPLVGEVLRKLAEDGKVAFHARGGVKRWFLVGDDR